MSLRCDVELHTVMLMSVSTDRVQQLKKLAISVATYIEVYDILAMTQKQNGALSPASPNSRDESSKAFFFKYGLVAHKIKWVTTPSTSGAER